MTTVTVNPKALAGALSRATGGIERIKTYPILQCVRLSAAAGVLTIDATDLDRAVSVSIDAKGDLAPICLDYARLISAVSTAQERNEMQIVVGARTAVLAAGRSRLTLPFLDADTWPNLREATWDATFTVDGSALARLMTALDPAIYTLDDRLYLKGIYLAPGTVRDAKASGHLTAVATDGHKMYARHIAASDIPGSMPGIIVPGTSTRGIAKIVAEREAVTISCNDRKLCVSVDGITFITKLIDGRYPDWRRTVPAAEASISYDTATLRAAARTVEAAKAGEKAGKSRAVKMILGAEETELEARDTSNPDFTGHDVVRHSLLSPPACEQIGINVNYLLEMLERLDAETVDMSFPTNPMGAIGINSPTHDDRTVVIQAMLVA